MTLRNLMPFRKKSIPVKHEEGSPFAFLRREMDEIFDNFYQVFEMEPFGGRPGTFSPHIDVVENDREIKVKAELPGMDEKDIDVSINEDTLTIRGEKKEEQEDKGKDYYRMERSYGSFTRTIPLLREVETDRVEAKFKKGVLTIVLPKTAKAVEETKKIAVKTE